MDPSELNEESEEKGNKESSFKREENAEAIDEPSAIKWSLQIDGERKKEENGMGSLIFGNDIEH